MLGLPLEDRQDCRFQHCDEHSPCIRDHAIFSYKLPGR